MRKSILPFVILSLFIFNFDTTYSCTSLLVTKGASVDGSTMVTYTCDGEFHPHLEYTPAADYPPGDSVVIEDWRGNIHGYIDQVEHTYAVVNMMNDHQLAIGETTFDGREELHDCPGILHYFDLIHLALQRAATAREAIDVIADLAERYGYRSTGESFSIADQDEVWIMELIGSGPESMDVHWVALKVPDGYISAHANKARIGGFPLDKPEICLYSKDVINFAIAKGFYDPGSGEPFRFNEAYDPPTGKNRRWADGRVWSLFRRAAPSLKFSPDYFRGVEESDPYPLWIKPDKKISVGDVFELMRDHFEDTSFDMTKGVDAGPFGCPYRFRPLYFNLDSLNDPETEYGWERPISTQQTAYSFVTQSRGHLPDPIGGLVWYGVDDTYYTCYFPLYCGINKLPEPFTVGSFQEFSWESAWWVFNLVANYSWLRYSDMVQDIRTVQSELEDNFLTLCDSIDRAALNLYQTDGNKLAEYLTDYSVSSGNMVFERWQKLAGELIVKYNDGYIKNDEGRARGAGYPEEWLKIVTGLRPDQFKIPRQDDTTGSRLVD